MTKTLLNSFDTWTDAQGVKSKGRLKSIENISHEGLARLRELILELALNGKLTSQSNEDEPAIELLKRIKIERGKEGLKSIVSKNISDSEKQISLPKGWQFIRLHQIIRISSGDGLTSSKMNENGSIPVFGGNGITGYHNISNVKKPTLVIGRVGYYCGSIHITPEEAWVTDNAFRTYFSEKNIDINFLVWLLKGTDLKVNQSATAQPVISGKKIYPIVISLPPLEEQKRIVAKVDELMVLCDELEKERTTNLKTHQLLVKTLLKALTQASNAEELQAAWERMSNHFDVLFCTEDSIDQLKQIILQLSIMGKLVKQNPNGKPANDLLKKIAAEKAKLIEEGKIRKEKKLPPIKEKKLPYQLPPNWVWARLDDIVHIEMGQSPPSSSYNTKGIGEILINGPVEFSDGNFGLTKKIKYTSEPTKMCKKGDLILCIRASIGRTNIASSSACVGRGVAAIRPFIHFKYNHYFLLANSQSIYDLGTGTTFKSVSKDPLREILFPLPPLEEQERIAVKIDELIGLCDALSNHLTVSQKLQNLLSKTLVEKAVQ
ncbi:restriction endonuclease subunit S [Croceitalea rosinachiae]|uniref:Restriction endonuclease subunit S n=1 Tax=Croceitalea rosinachiae TaxID=3075596 RepID=A0ABU3A8H0_9FLAO|nr:restriction endonuclease subunit S [Croceitalea sp. F388]MDT0606095.1 restriction endonuclease subunit S [Croceitalea sp. F388]